MPSTQPIRILIADDHALMRAGLRAIIKRESDLILVGEASDGIEAVSLTNELKPDVLLLDILMPNLDGLGALERVKQDIPDTRVLMLTASEDETLINQVLLYGGAGYVLKKSADTDLLAAIRTVMAGGPFVRPQLAEGSDSEFATRTLERLTARELQVLSLIVRGYTNQEIADTFILSVRTVETHRARIMEKLGVKTRQALMRLVTKGPQFPAP